MNTDQTRRLQQDSTDLQFSEAGSWNFCDYLYECYNNLPILNPIGSVRVGWDLFVIVLLLYTCIEIPFTLGFGITLTLNDWAGDIAFAIDILLLVDVCLNFRTAYFDEHDDMYLITAPSQIAKRYFRGWFLADFITSFPFEFLFSAEHKSIGTAVKAFRILRILRIIKIIRFIKMLNQLNSLMHRFISQKLILFLQLCKFLFIIVLFGHFCACAWYFIGDYCIHNEDVCQTSWLEESSYFDYETSTMFEKYSISWYWSVATLMTTGYGDIVATNAYEQWVSSVVILVGTVFFAYFINAVGGLLLEGEQERVKLNEQISKAQKFCQFKKLPNDLSLAIIAHTKYHCKNNLVDNEIEIINDLPTHMKSDVNVYIGSYGSILNKLALFENIDCETIGKISLKMKTISCNEGYKLFSRNESGNEFYIQRSGESLLVNNKNKKRKLTRGDVCGEESLLDKKRHNSLTCQTWCEFYVINCDDIWTILQQQYPKTYLVLF